MNEFLPVAESRSLKVAARKVNVMDPNEFARLGFFRRRRLNPFEKLFLIAVRWRG